MLWYSWPKPIRESGCLVCQISGLLKVPRWQQRGLCLGGAGRPPPLRPPPLPPGAALQTRGDLSPSALANAEEQKPKKISWHTQNAFCCPNGAKPLEIHLKQTVALGSQLLCAVSRVKQPKHIVLCGWAEIPARGSPCLFSLPAHACTISRCWHTAFSLVPREQSIREICGEAERC